MRGKFLLGFLVFSLFSITCVSQEKEKKFGFELSSGPAIAPRKLGGVTLNTGYGFEGIFRYRIVSFTDIYAGWGWNHFAAENSFAGNNVSFEETGYVLGLQCFQPIVEGVSVYIRGGALYNHIEIENESGELLYDTGHGFGFQLATGIEIAIGLNWNLNSGIKLNSLNREIESISTNLNLNHISMNIGIVKRF